MPGIHRDEAAFSMPGGDSCNPSRKRPIDLVHLARQTLGDRALEQEVLRIFIRQALDIQEQLVGSDPEKRVRLAHTLKGSASGVGAFVVAEYAWAIEKSPEQASLITALAEKISDVRQFLSSISR